MFRPRLPGTALVLALLLAGPVAAAPPVESPREALSRMEQALDAAVRKVSRASALHSLGVGDACRGYHLKGYGAVFVLSPRALPTGGSRIVVFRNFLTAPRAENADRRKKAQEQMSQQLRVAEENARAIQREAEQAQAEAERVLERAFEEAAREGIGQRVVASPPEPPTAPEPPSPVPPPPPPWRFWLESEESGDERAPDTILADVRGAVTAAIEAEGARLAFLRPEESVVVAVDFFPFLAFSAQAGPERTIVVRARKKDLDERQAGKMASEELRRRFEYAEY